MRKRWTPEQEYLLRQHYPDNRAEFVAKIIGRDVKSVYFKAGKLGLKKSAAFMADPVLSGRLTRGSHKNSVATRFQKGHTTWNKGKAFDSGGRSHETRFKVGQKPANRREVGELRITTDGNLEIKIAHGMRQWKTLSHYVWFLETGKWPPKGMVLRAKNGDQHDTAFDNLELITRQENMRRNSYHTNYPPEIRTLVQLKGAITRQVNRITKEMK